MKKGMKRRAGSPSRLRCVRTDALMEKGMKRGVTLFTLDRFVLPAPAGPRTLLRQFRWYYKVSFPSSSGRRRGPIDPHTAVAMQFHSLLHQGIAADLCAARAS